jgi:hypothetical protein
MRKAERIEREKGGAEGRERKKKRRQDENRKIN